MWTRNFIASCIMGLPDIQPVTNRLLAIPKDFSCFLANYYGKEKSEEFCALLTNHLLITIDFANAARRMNPNRIHELRGKWYDNADEFACFLNKLIPVYNEADFKKYFYYVIKTTEEMISLRIKRQYAQEIELFGCTLRAAADMAQDMADAMIFQLRI